MHSKPYGPKWTRRRVDQAAEARETATDVTAMFHGAFPVW